MAYKNIIFSFYNILIMMNLLILKIKLFQFLHLKNNFTIYHNINLKIYFNEQGQTL